MIFICIILVLTGCMKHRYVHETGSKQALVYDLPYRLPSAHLYLRQFISLFHSVSCVYLDLSITVNANDAFYY